MDGYVKSLNLFHLSCRISYIYILTLRIGSADDFDEKKHMYTSMYILCSEPTKNVIYMYMGVYVHVFVYMYMAVCMYMYVCTCT